MPRAYLLGLAVLALVATSYAAYTLDVNFQANANVSINGEPVTAAHLDAGGLQLRLKPLLNSIFSRTGSGYISATTGVNVSLIPLRVGLDYEVDLANLAPGGPYALNAHWNASVLQVIPGFELNAAASVNLIASFPYAIVEVDKDGVDVVVHMVKDFTWSVLDSFKAAASASANIGVMAYQCEGDNDDSTKFGVVVGLQTSVVAGVSNWARYNLLPRSWVHSMNITNYVFRTAGNSLRVVQAVATGSVNVNLNTAGSLTLPCDNNPLLQAYADLNATVILKDGTTAQADVSAWAKITNNILDSFPVLKAQLDAKFNTDVSVYLSNVTFPADQGDCTCTGRSATGSRLAEAQQAPIAPIAPVSGPAAGPFAPGTPIPEPIAGEPSIPSPSSASALPASFAVVIAVLAMLGMFF